MAERLARPVRIRPSWSRRAAPRRLELRPRPLALVLALRRSIHHHWTTTSVVERGRSGPPSVRLTLVTAVHGPSPAGLAPAVPPALPPTALRSVLTVLERSATLRRLVVLRPARTAPGPTGPAGPMGPLGPRAPVPPPMVVRTVTAAPAPAAPPEAGATAAEAHAGPVERVQHPASRTPAPAAADLDEITTQVLRRIERRAIAQRERMGRA